MSTILYRKDIDGLRAIAVLAVVLFHAFPLLCTGGYIGVDIFFVISGFLITSIIVKDIDNSRFTLQTFYLKRVKRIFPALIIFLSVFLLFGYFVLFDEEYANFGEHVFSSSLFTENSPKFRKLGILSVFKIAINNKVVSMCKSLLKFSEGLLNKLNSKVAKKKYPITLIKNIRVW